MSPTRPPRDIEGVNRVLTVLGLLLAVSSFGALSYGAWRVLDEIRMDESGAPATIALTYGVLAAVFAALGAGCLRLSRDDGSGTWCEACIARNPHNAPLCETCGAVLP